MLSLFNSSPGVGAALGLVHGASWLLALACELLVLVFIATVVRRHRPDGYGGLLVWAIASLAWGILGNILSTVVNVVAARGGIDAMLTGQMVMAGLHTAARIVLALLLVRGLVKLAQPPKPVVVESGAAYR